jgi:tellurite methyltransferase
MIKNPYDEKYNQKEYYWGTEPSKQCYQILQLMPPDKHLRVLDIGCGEGRNAVFLAGHGYDTSAFDLSEVGVRKTEELARQKDVEISAFRADLNDYRLESHFDILFSTGVLHHVPQELRAEVFENCKEYTSPGGLNVFSVFVKKPFIPRSPDAEITAHKWISGELLGLYHDWRIEWSTEEIFDCMSSGVPHQHAVNRVIARKVTG